MNDFLDALVSISIQATAIILVITLVRLAFSNKLSARTKYALWLIPLARLALPFELKLESPLSLMGVLSSLKPASAVAQTAMVNYVPSYNASHVANAVTFASPPASAVTVVPAPTVTSTVSAMSISEIILLIWLIGAALSLAYAVCINLRFSIVARREREYLCENGGLAVYSMKNLSSPCLAGIFKPYILVNDAAAQNCGTLSYALLHEKTHLAKRDNIWALIRSLICCVFWFNPFVWLAAELSRRDCELACDERVMRNFDSDERERYGMALISLLCEPQRPKLAVLSASTAMTGLKRAMKKRIEKIAHKQRFSRAVTAVALVLIVLLSTFACAAPKTVATPEPATTEPAATKPATEPVDTEALATIDAPIGAAELKTGVEPTPGLEDEVIADYPMLELVTSKGKTTIVAGEEEPELAKLMDKCILDSLVLSSAWPSVDVEEYKPYIVLTQKLTENGKTETHNYYAFVMNGKPCLQGGAMYTSLGKDNFDALVNAFWDANTMGQSGITDILSKLEREPYEDLHDEAHAKAVAEQAKLVIGKQYELGGNGPDTFCMSGLVWYAMNNAGVTVSLSQPSGYYYLSESRLGMDELLPGDIVMFEFGNGGTDGCAIYIGDGEIVYASSAADKVIKQELQNSKYFSEHFLCGVRWWSDKG